MISRKSAGAIANCYTARFAGVRHVQHGSIDYVHCDVLYDFLFENDYSAWFCNQSKRLSTRRGVKEWIMRLHTAETQIDVATKWTWEQRQQLGQRYLCELAEDMLRWWDHESEEWRKRDLSDTILKMTRQLELDGYAYRGGRLLSSE